MRLVSDNWGTDMAQTYQVVMLWHKSLLYNEFYKLRERDEEERVGLLAPAGPRPFGAALRELSRPPRPEECDASERSHSIGHPPGVIPLAARRRTWTRQGVTRTIVFYGGESGIRTHEHP